MDALIDNTDSIDLQIPGRTESVHHVVEATIFDAKNCVLESFKTKKDESVEWFDLDKIIGTVKIRPRRQGDKFWPLGAVAEKKIGKFLTAAHIERELREELLIFADDEKIIWIAPVRPSELSKVRNTTREILQLELQSKL